MADIQTGAGPRTPSISGSPAPNQPETQVSKVGGDEGLKSVTGRNLEQDQVHMGEGALKEEKE